MPGGLRLDRARERDQDADPKGVPGPAILECARRGRESHQRLKSGIADELAFNDSYLNHDAAIVNPTSSLTAITRLQKSPAGLRGWAPPRPLRPPRRQGASALAPSLPVVTGRWTADCHELFPLG